MVGGWDIFSFFSGWVRVTSLYGSKSRVGLSCCDHQARKRKRLIIEGVALTDTAVAMWFNESCIEKAPGEDYELLRQQIYRSMCYGSKANCYN